LDGTCCSISLPPTPHLGRSSFSFCALSLYLLLSPHFFSASATAVISDLNSKASYRLNSLPFPLAVTFHFFSLCHGLPLRIYDEPQTLYFLTTSLFPPPKRHSLDPGPSLCHPHPKPKRSLFVNPTPFVCTSPAGFRDFSHGMI